MSDFYNDIEQFRNIVRQVKDSATYVRTEEDGTVIRNPNAELPTLEFFGSVKLHGCNAGIRYDSNEITTLSRNNELSIEKDNYGFASFVNNNINTIVHLFRQLHFMIPFKPEKIIIYGEWAGPGIQSGVAISQLEDKKFFIFDVKVIRGEEVYWLKHTLINSLQTEFIHPRIKFIYDYQMYSSLIDFNNPDHSVNTMVKWVEEVEQECPVAKQFGVSSIGEGIVFFHEIKTSHENLVQKIRYKVKGKKHSVSKVKTLAAVDPEKLNSISEFVEYAVTENRLNQMIEHLKRDGIEVNDKATGTFLKYLNNDIIKEELDVLAESGLEFKDVVKSVATVGRKFFLGYIAV
jgi:hypothetical protein